MITHEIAANRIEGYRARNALIRGTWYAGNRTPNGYERACLLVAMAPEVGGGDYAACPTSLLPEWMAELTPLIDDLPSAEAWPRVINEYIACLRGSGSMTPESWRRLDYRCRLIAVEEARSHCPANETQVLAAIDGVISLLRRAIAGENVSEEEWKASAWASARAAARAARAAAARAAARAAWASARAASAAGWAAAASAAAAAADRMVFAMLAAWRDELA